MLGSSTEQYNSRIPKSCFHCISLLWDRTWNTVQQSSPQYVKDKYLLERVSTSIFTNVSRVNYRTSNGSRSWDYGHLKRVVIEPTYWKFLNRLKVSWSHFFIRVENRTTRGHNWKIMKNSSCDLRYHFFSQRSVNRWNTGNLTQEEVNAPSINSFKNHLEKRRRWKMDFFTD